MLPVDEPLALGYYHRSLTTISQPFMSNVLRTLLMASFLLPATTYADSMAMTNDPAATELLDTTGYTGTVLIHDMTEHTSIAGHIERIDDAVLPASTFKVFSTLAALEAGIVTHQEDILAWDGTERSRPEINQDLDLKSAFQLSAVPHYQALVRDIGAERIQQMIDETDYGNRSTGGAIDTFWLEGDLKISARQQVEFLSRVYRGDVPFSSAAIDTLKEIMLIEETPEYRLSAKTGWAMPDGGDNIGWWAGWVERDEDVYIFATMLRSDAPGSDFGPVRLEVTREILEQLQILPATER